MEYMDEISELTPEMIAVLKRRQIQKLLPNIEVRALSWKQPYLDLMAHGKIETRTWSTNYRGWVLMCGSKTPYSFKEYMQITGLELHDKIRHIGLTSHENLHKSITFNGINSQALYIGRLVDCREMNIEDELTTYVQYRAPWQERVKVKHEMNLADGVQLYRLVNKRLYCHVYADVMPIEPFEWHGTQGWKILTEEQKLKIKLL